MTTSTPSKPYKDVYDLIASMTGDPGPGIVYDGEPVEPVLTLIPLYLRLKWSTATPGEGAYVSDRFFLWDPASQTPEQIAAVARNFDTEFRTYETNRKKTGKNTALHEEAIYNATVNHEDIQERHYVMPASVHAAVEAAVTAAGGHSAVSPLFAERAFIKEMNRIVNESNKTADKKGKPE